MSSSCLWCIKLPPIREGVRCTIQYNTKHLDYHTARFVTIRDALKCLEWLKSEHIEIYRGIKIIKTFDIDNKFYYINMCHEYNGFYEYSNDLQEIKDKIDKRLQKKKVTYINI